MKSDSTTYSILVVDDMAILREPIASALSAAGFKTTCAASGSDALLQMRASAPDLLLLDVSMPGMDGIAVLRQMRADTSTSAIPVMLLSPGLDEIVRPLLLTECRDAIGADIVTLDLNDLRSQVISACGSLGGEPTNPIPPLATQRPLRIVYFCDDDRADFDPLRKILEMLVTSVIDTAITDGLCPSCDAIIVSSKRPATATLLASLRPAASNSPPILYLTSEWPRSITASSQMKVESHAPSTNLLLRFLDTATAN